MNIPRLALVVILAGVAHGAAYGLGRINEREYQKNKK